MAEFDESNTPRERVKQRKAYHTWRGHCWGCWRGKSRGNEHKWPCTSQAPESDMSFWLKKQDMTRRLTCGTETGVGGEGARLMILLQFGLEREMSKKIFSSCVSDYPALTCIQIQQKHRQSTQTWDKRSSGSCLCRWGGNCRDIARTWNIIIVSIFGPVITIIIFKKSLLSARRRIPDRRCLVARVALHHMLVFLARDVDHCLRSHCLLFNIKCQTLFASNIGWNQLFNWN